MKNVIKSLGYDVVSQVGCSNYRIDLGVIDPAHPGCFILGIECDGRMYHSAYTARERDRIRQEVLESLGWKLHRIWSPDWFFRKKEEIDRLKNALEKARVGSRCNEPEKNDPRLKVIYHENVPEDFRNDTEEIITYRCFKYRGTYPSYEFNLIDSASRRDEILTELVGEEGPMHIDLTKRRLISVWGISRIGSIVEETLDQTIRNCLRQNRIYKKGNFLWDRNTFTINSVRVPDPDKPETTRDPDFICEEEIQLAICLMVKKAIGIEKEPLFTEIARLFGWRRTGEKVEHVIDKAFKGLAKLAKISINDSLVTLSES